MAVTLLMLATGLCLFDQDEYGGAGHVTPPDLCLVVLAASLAMMSLAGLLAVGWASSLSFAAACAAALHVPDPPPKLPSLL
jgi:hypothetical protein